VTLARLVAIAKWSSHGSTRPADGASARKSRAQNLSGRVELATRYWPKHGTRCWFRCSGMIGR